MSTFIWTVIVLELITVVFYVIYAAIAPTVGERLQAVFTFVLASILAAWGYHAVTSGVV